MQHTVLTCTKGFLFSYNLFSNTRRAKLHVSGLLTFQGRYSGTPHQVTPLTDQTFKDKDAKWSSYQPRNSDLVGGLFSVDGLNENHTALGQESCMHALLRSQVCLTPTTPVELRGPPRPAALALVSPGNCSKSKSQAPACPQTYRIGTSWDGTQQSAF